MNNGFKTLVYLHDIKIPYISIFSKLRVFNFSVEVDVNSRYRLWALFVFRTPNQNLNFSLVHFTW